MVHASLVERYANAVPELEGTTRAERVQSLWRVLRANSRRDPPAARGDDDDAAAEVLAMARDAVLSEAEREEQVRELRAEARPGHGAKRDRGERPPLARNGRGRRRCPGVRLRGGRLPGPERFHGSPTAVAPPASSDSAYSEGSSDSDASDSSGGAVAGAVRAARPTSVLLHVLPASSSRLVDGPARLGEAPEGFFRLGCRGLQGVAVFAQGRNLGLLGALPRERAAERAEHEILLVLEARDTLVVLALVGGELVEMFARRAEGSSQASADILSQARGKAGQ